MESVKLKKNGVVAWLYAYVTSVNQKDLKLPQSLCGLFWLCILGIFVILFSLPIFILSRILKWENDELGGALVNFGMSICLYVICGVLGLAFRSLNDLLVFACVMLGTAVYIAFMYGLRWICTKANRKFENWRDSRRTAEDWERVNAKLMKKAEKKRLDEKARRNKTEPQWKTNLRIWWDSYLNKYCPKVNWIEND